MPSARGGATSLAALALALGVFVSTGPAAEAEGRDVGSVTESIAVGVASGALGAPSSGLVALAEQAQRTANSGTRSFESMRELVSPKLDVLGFERTGAS